MIPFSLATWRPRVLIVALTLLCLCSSTGFTPALARQAHDDRIDTVTSTVIELSRQQENGDLFDIYDRMHPDARNQLSRQAFVRWVESGAMPVPLDDPQINDVTFGDWTWAATGEEYHDVARVSVTQAVARDGREATESADIVFVNDGQRWRWFPDLTASAIAGLASEVTANPSSYQPAFRQAAYAEIDRFWEEAFDARGLHYTPPSDIVAITREPYDTGCGTESEIAQYAIYYCVDDATVYYDPEFRRSVVAETGPYGWTMIVSHEWGHHIQALLGIDTVWDPELASGLYPIELELQADCLAGIFAQDAMAMDLIDQDEIDSAVAITDMSGDAPGTEWDDYDAHGTSDQRVQSFYTGFDDGFTGCHLDLAVPTSSRLPSLAAIDSPISN